MYRVDLIIVQIDDERNHDKGNVYIQGTYSLLYSVVYNILATIDIHRESCVIYM